MLHSEMIRSGNLLLKLRQLGQTLLLFYFLSEKEQKKKFLEGETKVYVSLE